jgi:hypothetical protein
MYYVFYLIILSDKIHRCGWFGGLAAYVAIPPNQPQRCISVTITLASSNNKLPDDGD